MHFPNFTDEQANLLAIFAFDPTGYIDEVELVYEDLFKPSNIGFDRCLKELIELKVLNTSFGENEYFSLSAFGFCALVAAERSQGINRTYQINRYYSDTEAHPQAEVLLYLIGDWYGLNDLSGEALGFLSAICSNLYIWPLLVESDNYKQRDLTMFAWLNTALWSDSAKHVEVASALVTKIPTAKPFALKDDLPLLGMVSLPDNDVFIQPYSTESLAQLWPPARLNSPKVNFRTLIDLAALAIYYPEKVDELADKLTNKIRQTGLFVETAACWYQVFMLGTNHAELLEQRLGTADKWLATIAIGGRVGWGNLMIELLTIFRLFSLKPNLHQQLLPALVKNAHIQNLLQCEPHSPIGQKAMLGLRQLLNPQEQFFCTPVDHVGKWFAQLNHAIEGKSNALERIVWQLDEHFTSLNIKIQKRNKKGWSKGRQINLRDLDWKYSELLDDIDRQLIQAVDTSHYYWQNFDVTVSVARLLAECDHVIDADGESVSIYPEKPLLLVQEENEALQLAIYPQSHGEDAIEQKQSGILTFLDRSEKLKHFFDVFEQFPQGVPITESVGLETALQAVPDLCWYSEVSATGSVECKAWSAQPSVWLNWRDLSMDVAIEHGPEDCNFQQLSQPSGQGEAWLSLLSNAKAWFKRDLNAEKSSAQTLVKTLELPKRKDFQWRLDFQHAIAFLDTLAQHPTINLHWRGEQKVKVLSEKSLKLEVTQKEKWFKVEGVAAVDKELELELRTLLANSHANYKQLDDGSVLLITDSLKRQLRLLDSVLDDDQQVDSRMAYPLAQLINSISHNGDTGWQALTDKWREKPILEASHLIQLRDYQKTSVLWAAHLAHHQFGACLADDMGLGKTIQALTLLRHFANQGPALVVAPKSVVHNWEQEAQRFAPELNILSLEDSTAGAKLIEQADRNYVVLLSYGLLTRLEKPLQEKEWQSIVLDEAQNIKNPATKRAKLIFQLQAKCRFALTGTPIENHLLELWSLFNFINPGLLGGKTQFVKTYGKAAKNDEDMARLKTLVSPFIMRRLKSQVLKELPAKTEITHEITLSKPERTAYEAVRKQVLAQAKQGKGLVEVLSGLTKLRQVCCDPRLVFDTIKEPGSKLIEACTLVQEALESGHKILIFSQFVKVLKGFAALLNEQQLNYSYLDGQSTHKQRQKAIADFKQGEHPLFLISLKAGGTGLNLTEADMVIHLDPWWNPAVEDQASDRAHRMGQTKPVTVYRLVAEDSIEQKIIRLHEEKRELADKLLDGESSSKALSPEVLLGLLGDVG